MKTIAIGLCAVAVLTGSAFGESFASTVKGDLVALKGKRASKYDDAPLANAKYFAVYFSASWCGPCKAFTPDLVKWYNETKPQHPEFELIFVSRDTDEKAMEAYMAADQMPWPALKFSKVERAKNIKALGGAGIPCLVFLDAEGKVLSHSYEGQNYVGPRKVMAEIGKTLGAATPADTGTPPPAAATAPDPAPAATTAAPAATAPAATNSGNKPAPSSPQGSNFDQFFKKKNP